LAVLALVAYKYKYTCTVVIKNSFRTYCVLHRIITVLSTTCGLQFQVWGFEVFSGGCYSLPKQTTLSPALLVLFGCVFRPLEILSRLSPVRYDEY